MLKKFKENSDETKRLNWMISFFAAVTKLVKLNGSLNASNVPQFHSQITFINFIIIERDS